MNLFISKDGSKVLEELYTMLMANVTASNASLKIDRNGYKPSEGGIMPVHLELRAQWPERKRSVFSVAHYFEQNGDLCADPLMEFLRIESPEGPLFIATYFQRDGGIFATRRDSVEIDPDNGTPTKYLKRSAVEDRVFATSWMRNIAWQQELKANNQIRKAS